MTASSAVGTANPACVCSGLGMVSVIVAFMAKLQIPSSKLQIPPWRDKNQTSRKPPRAHKILELDAWCFSGAWMLALGAFSSVTFPHHKIKRPKDSGNVAHHMSRQQMRHNAQVHK